MVVFGWNCRVHWHWHWHWHSRVIVTMRNDLSWVYVQSAFCDWHNTNGTRLDVFVVVVPAVVVVPDVRI